MPTSFLSLSRGTDLRLYRCRMFRLHDTADKLKNTHFYDVFYPVCTSGSTYNWLLCYSNGDNAEALLRLNSSGQLTLTAAEQPDANGRYANGISWKIFYADTGEEYEYRERIYTQVTMTKTSSKGVGGLEEELPPPDPEGARAFMQR